MKKLVTCFCLLLAASLFPCIKKTAKTCSDPIHNQNETAVQCGDICCPWPSFCDHHKIQNEAGTDCGGSCTAGKTIHCNVLLGFSEIASLPNHRCCKLETYPLTI